MIACIMKVALVDTINSLSLRLKEILPPFNGL